MKSATQSPGSDPIEWCTVVVPCFNEEHRLRTEEFRAFIASEKPIRFLFVNDGSRDGTLAVLERLKAANPLNVDVLDLPRNLGKAEAVRHGMQQAIQQGDTAFTGFWDADLATPLDEIHGMLAKLLSEPALEMIFGSRVRLLGRDIKRNPARHYLGRVFATVVSVTMRLPVYDSQCGAKLFRVTPALRTIVQTPFLSRWIFDVEILARFMAIHKADPEHVFRAIYEIPLRQWTDIAGSKVHPMDFFRSFYELIQLRARYPR